MLGLNPKFFNESLAACTKLEDIPAIVFDEINSRLFDHDEDPYVSIVVPAWNEESNIVKCIDSLSQQNTDRNFEIIVVDNNSKDATRKSIEALNVKYLFQEIQGCGPARQLGQEYAKGEFILMADADCIYPPGWLDILTNALMKEDVVCVYGNYSFLTENIKQKIGMVFYEFARAVIARIRHIKRPFLNCLGMNMGYVKKHGLEIGFIEQNIRGEDGRMAYSLMKYGRIKRVGNRKATVYTGYRTLVRKGSLINAFFSRFISELNELKSYTKKIKDHDPKTTLSEKNPSAYIEGTTKDT